MMISAAAVPHDVALARAVARAIGRRVVAGVIAV
jgi:hypothetical protein